MIYNGLFRSIDTSVDPNGQLYKVVILTNISEDGYYPYHEMVDLSGNSWLVPDSPVELQLADKPFSIQYQADKKNIYKPYKCSTATVNIMLDTIYPQLISVKKNDILVMLLKWKNDVHEVNGAMIDGQGNALNKVVIGRPTVYRDYLPQAYDEFCFDLEWIGYATPNTYSQSYVRVLESYSLECQDILSTLKYYDYNPENIGVKSFFNTITECLKNVDMGYKSLYITNGVSVLTDRLKPAVECMCCDDNNWFDEDNKPTNCLAVIEEIMKYLNCTIIPIKGNLVITNYDAIAQNYTFYDEFHIHSGQHFIQRGEEWDWESGGSVNLRSNINLLPEMSAGSNTNISISDTYRKVRLTTDEYYKDKFVPSIGDDKDFDVINSETGTASFHSNEDGGYTKMIYYDLDILQCNNDNGTIETYSYEMDSVYGSGDNTQWLPNTTRVANATSLAGTITRVGCVPVEFDAHEVKLDTLLSDVCQNYNGSRFYLFHTLNGYGNGMIGYGTFSKDLFINSQNVPTNVQPMFKFESADSLIKAGQYIQIEGDFTFYNTKMFPVESGWNSTVNDELCAISSYQYVWAQVYVTDGTQTKWAKNIQATSGVNYSYEWVSNPTWCKLYYGGRGWESVKSQKYQNFWQGGRQYRGVTDNSAFENTFSLVKNNRAVDGTVIEIPSLNGDFYGKVGVIFNRPVGCAATKAMSRNNKMYFAQCTTLENFNVNILDSSDLEYRHDDNSVDRNNGEFSVEMSEYAVDEYGGLNLKLSSGYKKTTNISNVMIEKIDSGSSHLEPVKRVYNIGIGAVALPEWLKVNSIAETYKIPRYILNSKIHDQFDSMLSAMLSAVTWNSQFGNRKFVVNSISIDYEMNITTLDLLDKKLSVVNNPTTYLDIVRNYRRNGDNLYAPLPHKEVSEVHKSQQPIFIRPRNIYRQDEYAMFRGQETDLLSFLHFDPNAEDGMLNVVVPDDLNVNVVLSEDGILTVVV